MSGDRSDDGGIGVADDSDRLALEEAGGRAAGTPGGGLDDIGGEDGAGEDGAENGRDVIAELAVLPAAQRARLVETLTAAELHELHDRWAVWAHPGQHLEAGAKVGSSAGAGAGAGADDWRIWVILAGRGFGKTRAGAEWVSQVARDNPGARIALVGATIDDVRRVMIEGKSGLLAVARDDEDPVWRAGLGELRFANGALASAYSAEAPEGLRGPEHHVAWCDEVAKWRNGKATWDNLMMGLRLGTLPRIVVTTTPKPVALLRRILALPGVVRSQGRTRDNVHLPVSFVESMTASYAGTRLGRQELDGELIEDVVGALWTRELVESRRVAFAPAVVRVVVGVDPPAGSVSGGPGDACGIVVVALGDNGFAYVLEDASVSGASPEGWARAVAECAARHGADRVIAEANQGGTMVGSVLSGADRAMPVKLVHASLGKVARAEPVAALYESGRAWHVGAFPDLEDELCGLIAGGGYEGPGRSPDRADALVWAMTEVMLGPRARVSVRVL